MTEGAGQGAASRRGGSCAVHTWTESGREQWGVCLPRQPVCVDADVSSFLDTQCFCMSASLRRPCVVPASPTLSDPAAHKNAAALPETLVPEKPTPGGDTDV